MPHRSRLLLPMLGLCGLACVSSCGVKTPLQPVNRSPVVHSLIAFPTTISLGDSAVVVCHVTDPDGESLMFEWISYGPMFMRDGPDSTTLFYSRDNTVVVQAIHSANAPLDTGGVSCHVWDSRGGGARAGIVRIVIRQ